MIFIYIYYILCILRVFAKDSMVSNTHHQVIGILRADRPSTRLTQIGKGQRLSDRSVLRRTSRLIPPEKHNVEIANIHVREGYKRAETGSADVEQHIKFYHSCFFYGIDHQKKLLILSFWNSEFPNFLPISDNTEKTSLLKKSRPKMLKWHYFWKN